MPSDKQRAPINIILLGDPAAGKATQAVYLAKRFKLYDFDMGQELTRLRTTNEGLSSLLKQNYDKGKLTPTKLVREILASTIKKISPIQGILFDGHPKMLGEAKLASRLIKEQKRSAPIVIYLSIPLEETVKRMHNRKGYFDGKFGKRADDSDTALKNRVKYYRVNIAQVVEFFSSRYEYHKISGLGTPAQVRQRFKLLLDKFTQE